MKNFTTNQTNCTCGTSTNLRLDMFLRFVVVRAGSWLIILSLFFSCTRSVPDNTSNVITWHGALPAAILQIGEHPIWFLLTDDGPKHITSVEDVMYTSAFAPWPHVLHIRFLHKTDTGLVIAVNGGGFLLVTVTEHPGLMLYYFAVEESLRLYTTGGFAFFNNNPVITLYADNRFTDPAGSPAGSPAVPNPQTWTFNMESNNVFPIQIPAFVSFPAEDAWEIDALRYGSDGMIYYRAAKRSGDNPSVRMFRTADLSHTGEEISISVFQNSVLRPLDIFHSTLPDLPDGFFYTFIEQIEDNLFAAWEEQEGYGIGAAGFLVLKK